MNHATRRWLVELAPNAEVLAEKLSEHTWPLCQGFELSGYLFLNDADSEEGDQSYAIVKREGDRFFALSSVAFDWCAPERALQVIEETLLGEHDQSETRVEVFSLRLDSPSEHRTCKLCASKRRHARRRGGAK